MDRTADCVLAPRWSPRVLGELHEEVAVRLAAAAPSLRAVTRRAAVAGAMDRPVRRELAASLRMRYRLAGRRCWRSWAAGYAGGHADSATAVAAALAGKRRRRRRLVALEAVLAARTRRWNEVAGSLEPTSRMVPRTTR